jgi:site-specific DNA-methyltransferase (adenine-specific)
MHTNRSETCFRPDSPNLGDLHSLLDTLPAASVAAVVFDPQYRGVMDQMSYGNEGARQRGRVALPQMPKATIDEAVAAIARVLTPSGHLFLWLDKWELVESPGSRFSPNGLSCVDLVVWDKKRIGMGYRTRRRSEYLLVLQKPPRVARAVWTDRSIPDVWAEPISRRVHPHAKPVGLQSRLLAAVTRPGDLIVDPAAGGYSVLEAVCALPGRVFLGCDLLSPPPSRLEALERLVTERLPA